MNVSAVSQTVLLLTTPLPTDIPSKQVPLRGFEWSQLASSLIAHNLDPTALLSSNADTLLSDLKVGSIPPERFHTLLDRHRNLKEAMSCWENEGIWTLTRADPEYPTSLKQRLGMNSPPVLFGYGNKSLLNSGGIAIVGVRDASHDDLYYANNLGRKCASQKLTVISGGARGIDLSAMYGAMESRGNVVGVLANSLRKSIKSTHYQKYIGSNNLVLLTHFSPESTFTVANAMERNRLIYCLSDAGVVVNSTPYKGGSWNGALQNLKANWVPLWVQRKLDGRSGNPLLAKKGAKFMPENLDSLSIHSLSAEPSASLDGEFKLTN